MSIQTTYKCDVCGKQRGEGNHWLSMMQSDTCSPRFYSWDPQASEHVCSSACAHKALDEWLTAEQQRSHAQEGREQ